MLYAYANPLIKLGSVKHLEQDDLWELVREDQAAVVHASFQEELAKTVDPVSAPQVRTVVIGALWELEGVHAVHQWDWCQGWGLQRVHAMHQ